MNSKIILSPALQNGKSIILKLERAGLRGPQGLPGLNIEYVWNGTQLGIRLEGESQYQYVDLKGDKGDKGDQGIQGEKGDKGDKGDTGERGLQGIQGPSGKNLEFTWNGTQLGIRQEGQSSYQYVNLKGEKGDKGEQGIQGIQGEQGPIGLQGPKGDPFEYEDFTPAQLDGLKGPKGDKGDKGDMGPEGPQGPKGDKGDTGEIENLDSQMITDALGYIPLDEDSLPSNLETTTGSQAKANQAEQNAKDYTDQEISSIDIPDSTWESIQNKPDTFTPSPHNHTIGNITGLQNELNSKETPTGAQSKANTAEQNAKDYADVGLADKVDKVTGKGLSTNDYTTAEKNKLNGIQAGAQVNTVTSVAGRTGVVTVNKSDVGLSNVDNVKQMPLSGGVLENYREKLNTVTASGGSINLSLGNVFQHTPSGNTTYTITNAVNGQAHSFTLIINMGSTVRTITFPASVKWQGGEIPDMTELFKTYVLTFMTVDGGTNWLGMFGGEF